MQGTKRDSRHTARNALRTSGLEFNESTSVFSKRSSWYKFGAYKVVQGGDEYFVTPASDKVSTYSPFEISDQLLKDLYEVARSFKSIHGLSEFWHLVGMSTEGMLNDEEKIRRFKNISKFRGRTYQLVRSLIMTAIHATKDKDLQLYFMHQIKDAERNDAQLLREFSQKYGLLGLISRYGEYYEEPDGSQWVIGKDWRFFGRVPLSEYISYFSPKIRRDAIDQEFFRHYGEPVPAMIDEINNLYVSLVLSQELRGEKFKGRPISPLVFDPTTVVPVDSWPIGIEAVRDEATNSYHLGWRFNSLFDAISIMNVLNVVESKIRRCGFRRCQKLFVTSEKKKKFCDDKCNQNERKARQRAAEQERKAKHVENKKRKFRRVRKNYR